MNSTVDASPNFTTIVIVCYHQQAKIDKLFDHLEIVAFEYNCITNINYIVFSSFRQYIFSLSFRRINPKAILKSMNMCCIDNLSLEISVVFVEE